MKIVSGIKAFFPLKLNISIIITLSGYELFVFYVGRTFRPLFIWIIGRNWEFCCSVSHRDIDINFNPIHLVKTLFKMRCFIFGGLIYFRHFPVWIFKPQ